MITVSEALDKLFALAEPTGVEEVPLLQAAGRVLARPLAARRDQPPFAASAMDGYALRRAEVAPGARFKVVGEAAAGAVWSGRLNPGEAVRIFTGAPVPQDSDFVVIQEDTSRTSDEITLGDSIGDDSNIRPAGADFSTGDTLDAPRRLSPADVALLAAMNHPVLPVRRRPEVALIATGDELVQPGETPGPGQIIASNSYGLAALFQRAGAQVRLLPIARDTEAALAKAFELARGADLVITIGGASVGDYDLVGPVAQSLGMETAFYKVAMRPGKPLMAGRMSGSVLVGLPGNPVSAMVCGVIFVQPLLAVMQGLPARPVPRRKARLTASLAANGPREHYMRARRDGDGIAAFDRQDSSLLSILSRAEALIVRPPNAPAAAAGDLVEYIDF
ncbi:molybdopterin molybdotransferase MoeA [Frigidibacter sp. ROC022]|uniref:molybdopterin molybdotransferase MoeA n=1 Tax=Frigidibacter sp. ROC022 TaxID=2971796 RepID=UPI00215A62AF|nr:gephyrin-like molybdotransferase Glp [Frigidibacter sp. ROC022]MCR8725472.1 molybdopterin molybdotransferase MoeA [Frigidibacter sp. ROC022]